MNEIKKPLVGAEFHLPEEQHEVSSEAVTDVSEASIHALRQELNMEEKKRIAEEDAEALEEVRRLLDSFSKAEEQAIVETSNPWKEKK